MSLHIKLFTNFWTHRKTAKLRTFIGNDAFWIPPRLWCYAAENQPDGDFSKYSAEELAFLLGYVGDATSMLKALQEACFMNEMRINDWHEHNSYHHEFSERAKKAANARWAKESTKERNDKIGEDRIGDKQCIEHATSIYEPKNTSTVEQTFEEFWKLYPKKIGKGAAKKSWEKLKCNSRLKDILKAIQEQATCDQWRKDGGQFIPHPATWLNQERWNDEQTKVVDKSNDYSGWLK